MINQLVAAVMMASSLSPACPASSLPLGDADLAETRTTQTLARGVTLTSIVRGTDPAAAGEINTTTRGPWRVQVLTIDPRRARGHLQATYGKDLAGTETVTDLVRDAGALAGVNASFFTFTASQLYPGTPVGVGVYDGKLLSEPTTDPAEADLVVDHGRVAVGKLTWSGVVRNPRNGSSLALSTINEPPVVPAACPDQLTCTVPGQVASFTSSFAAQTPSGAGSEVVLDKRGCVVRSGSTRGTALATGETSLQATGSQTAELLALVTGCVRVTSSLSDAAGRAVTLHPDTYAVNGRYRLTENGEIVVPAGTGSFFARNPRTIAGVTGSGSLVLATIDGRQTTSVGTTMDETAAVAKALGLRDAINLDGGGSTTMSIRGELVNTPSGGSQRPVGDALVWVGR
ncbi:phosphodiester glycosidase family protein [Actinoplanes sp. CA-142083]|uniref:phosphodiester glycosidase family protein n=1 Tax=Actinoplanes sp. CA-142083 TaxID=3239903 RepID=UPI003D8E7B33